MVGWLRWLRVHSVPTWAPCLVADRLPAGSEAGLRATPNSRWLTATVCNESARSATAPGERARVQLPLRAARGRVLAHPRPHRCVTPGPRHAGSLRWCGPSPHERVGAQWSPGRHAPPSALGATLRELVAAEASRHGSSQWDERKGAKCLCMPAAEGDHAMFDQHPSWTTSVLGQPLRGLCRGCPLPTLAGGLLGRSPSACRRPWSWAWELERW